MICGMHVHVGLADDDLRIDLLSQVAYVLPHFLALSTSSPFWEGEHTGLRSYRMAVCNEMPRTGLPESFESYTEYQRHVDVLVRAGVIEDSTKIWWDIRPRAKFPTLELRICDISTRLKDTLFIAALYVCWLRMLYRLRLDNQKWRVYSKLLEEMRALVREDAEALGCVAYVEHARTIISRGTSAHMQVWVHEQAKADGADEREALRAVVDALIVETMAGLDDG
jgi:carboxylate-amine ligase